MKLNQTQIKILARAVETGFNNVICGINRKRYGQREHHALYQLRNDDLVRIVTINHRVDAKAGICHHWTEIIYSITAQGMSALEENGMTT